MGNKDSTATYPVGYQEVQISQPQTTQQLQVSEILLIMQDTYTGKDYQVRQPLIGNAQIGWMKFERFI